MKRPVRSLFPVLLLIVLVAVTLTCRVGFSQNAPGFTLTRRVIPVINATLAKLAEVDLGEGKLRQEVEQLLEGNFGNYGRHRSFLSSDIRERRYDRPRVRSFRGTPVKLRLPKFAQSLPEFRNNLRKWWRNKRNTPIQDDVMSDLISLIKIPIGRGNGKFSSCAVVGNSGILLKNKYGEFIDSHEAVIRLNNARTNGFEQNVGSKTSISFVNSNILHLCARREGCFCNPYGENVPLVMYICQPTHFLDYTICNSSQKSQLLVTDLRFDTLCSKIVKYYSLKRFVEEIKKPLEEWGSAHEGPLFHYSSGMQAIMLALGICEKVSILGFGKLDSAKHHYHTNQKAELHLHDYEAEYDLYRDLVERPEAIPFVSEKFKLPPVVIYQ